MEMTELTDKIRTMCARLADLPLDSAATEEMRSALKAVTAQLEERVAVQEVEWNKQSEGDNHQDEARQSYRSRETNSADGFAEGLKLFTPKKPDNQKKKD